MKRVLLLFSCLALSLTLSAQVLYSEDFENGWPADYTLYNVDGLTPNDPDLIGLADSAWTIRYITQAGVNSNTAFSVSWYLNDEGPSDDWMVLPAVDILDNTILSWEAMAITSSGDFRDRYQVAISTDGAEIDDFQANPLLFDTGNLGEEITLQSRSVNLADAGYANQTVYIAFRNFTAPYDPGQPQAPGNGGNELMIDNISIENTTVSVETIAAETLQLAILPQPAGPLSILRYTLENPADLQLEIFNLAGERVMQEDLGLHVPGTYQHQLELAEWTPGTYLIRLQTADWISSQLFILQN